MGMHVGCVRNFSMQRLSLTTGLGRELQHFQRYIGTNRFNLDMAHYGMKVFADSKARRVLDSIKYGEEFDINPRGLHLAGYISATIGGRGIKALIDKDAKCVYFMGNPRNMKLFNECKPLSENPEQAKERSGLNIEADNIGELYKQMQHSRYIGSDKLPLAEPLDYLVVSFNIESNTYSPGTLIPFKYDIFDRAAWSKMKESEAKLSKELIDHLISEDFIFKQSGQVISVFDRKGNHEYDIHIDNITHWIEISAGDHDSKAPRKTLESEDVFKRDLARFTALTKLVAEVAHAVLGIECPNAKMTIKTPQQITPPPELLQLQNRCKDLLDRIRPLPFGRPILHEPIPIMPRLIMTRLNERITPKKPETPAPLSIKDALEQLKHVNAAKRLEAVHQLGKMHNNDPVILQRLINIMRMDENAIVRAAAAKVLGVAKAIRALFPLVEALGDKDQRVLKEAWASLFELRSGALVKNVKEILIEGLTHENPAVQFFAAMLLGRIEMSSNEPPAELSIIALIKNLSDTEQKVRIAAAYALAEMGDVRMIEPILKAAKEEEVSKMIVLGIRENRSANTLLKDISEIGLNHAEGEVRESAADILHELGELNI